jgi:predicted transcriptional regulator
MSTFTIELPEELAGRLEAASEAREVTVSELIAQALEQALLGVVHAESSAEGSFFDATKSGCGSIDTGVPDLATDPHHLSGLGISRA